MLKINKNGDTLWSYYNDISPNGGEDCLDINQLPDSSFSIIGAYYDSTEGARNTFILKLSKTGELLSSNYLNFGFNEYCVKHFFTTKNEITLTGITTDSESDNSTLFIVRIDSNSTVVWQKNYTELTSGFYWLRNLEQTPDKGYILSGDYYENATNNQGLFLLKTDSVGNFKWIKYYGDSLVEKLGFAVSTPDDGYMMVSAKILIPDTTVSGWIFKTDSIGDILWQKQYYFQGLYSYFKLIRLLPDGSFIVGGNSHDQDFPQHRPRIWLLKFDAQGDTLWTRKFTYYGKSTQYADDTTTWEGCSYSDCGFMQAAIAVSADTLDLKYSDTLFFSSAGNYADQWLWNFSDMASSALQNPYYVFADSGTFNISLITYFNGCSDTAHKTVVVINSDCSYINAAFAASADTIDLQNTNIVTFTDASTQANQWLWNFGDSTTSSLQNPQHEFDTTGTFTVTLLAFYGNCSDTAFKTVVVKNSIGIENISFSQNGIKIIPNPAKEKVRIIVNETNAAITIFNAQGLRVFEKSISKETEIDVADWKSGVYAVKVRTEKSIFVGKMVRE